MSKEEKETWKELARENGKKHARDNPGYKYQPGKKKRKHACNAKRAIVAETYVSDMAESAIAQGPLIDASHVHRNSIASDSGSQTFNQSCFSQVTAPVGHNFSPSTYPPMAWTAGSSMVPVPSTSVASGSISSPIEQSIYEQSAGFPHDFGFDADSKTELVQYQSMVCLVCPSMPERLLI